MDPYGATQLKKTTAPSYGEHDAKVLELIRKNMKEISRIDDPSQFDNIMEAIGDAEVVMIGEASHGTEEFYRIRCEITKRLIEEKGFTFVGIEGDWPDTYRVHRYVCQGRGADEEAIDCLGDFDRFPRWMWRNYAVLDFIRWLHSYNKDRDRNSKAGFYGLDMYSMFKSIDAVIEYLEKVDSEAAENAKEKYGTLEKYRDDQFKYASDVFFKVEKSRQQEVISILTDLLRKGPEYLAKRGMLNGEELFYATQNARLVKSAEEYYRNALFGGANTWNIRDAHMVETVGHLIKFQKEVLGIQKPKAVLWAHNSHLGDARATEYKRETGEFNVGQLVRQKLGLPRSYNVGFTTYWGTVSAARTWGGQRQTFDLNPAFKDSYEYLFHLIGDDSRFSLILRSNSDKIKVDRELVAELAKERTERMVGVQYVKHRERSAHYCPALLSKQFDCVIHLDRTTALRPLDE